MSYPTKLYLRAMLSYWAIFVSYFMSYLSELSYELSPWELAIFSSYPMSYPSNSNVLLRTNNKNFSFAVKKD